MIGLHGDHDVYTRQLWALEADCKQNRDRAPVHFVLAYQYLTAEHPEARAAAMKDRDGATAQGHRFGANDYTARGGSEPGSPEVNSPPGDPGRSFAKPS